MMPGEQPPAVSGEMPLLPARGGDNLMMEVATSVKVPVSSRIKY